MLLLSEEHAPILTKDDRVDGMIRTAEGLRPGKILGLYAELRKNFGVLKAKDKPGVKFKVRSMEDLVDKLRADANEMGVLIYPAPVLLNDAGFSVFTSTGRLQSIEDGTLAEVNQAFVLQAVEDGSRLAIFGYGLGADNQDKAGGKAGTYAMKQALVQALLAGGKENAKALGVRDTDDSSDPIAGGVRAKKGKTTLADIEKKLDEVEDEEDYKELRPALSVLAPADQNKLRDRIVAAKTRAGIAVPTGK